MVSMLSKFNFQPSVSLGSLSGEPDNLEMLADCLEAVRDVIDLKPKLTTETRSELEASLAIAEAALRRAHMESKL